MENHTLAEVNRIITKDTITKEQEQRIQQGGYEKDGFYYTIREFSSEFPEGSFWAGLASKEHAEDTLFLARHFHPENDYRVTEIRKIEKDN
jgi:hypothetical protein